MTIFDTFVERDVDFDKVFLQNNGSKLLRPILINKGLTNIKSHSRTTVIAVLKAAVAEIGGEDRIAEDQEAGLTDYELNDAKNVVWGINQERARNRNILLSTIDKINQMR